MSQPRPPQTRQRGPSTAEWNLIRPVLEQLYIDEGRSLEDVSNVLATDYNFYAEPHMYKTRLRIWNLKRSFKSEELETAARRVGLIAAATHFTPTVLINGRVALIHKLKRHHGQFFKPVADDPTRCTLKCHSSASWPQRCQKSWYPHSQTYGAFGPEPQIKLVYSPSMDPFAGFLIQINNCYGAHVFSSSDTIVPGTSDLRPSSINLFKLVGDLSGVVSAYISRSTNIFRQKLQKIKFNASLVLKDQRLSLLLLPDLLDSLVDISQLRSGDFHRYLIALVRSLMARDFMEGHPLRLMLDLLTGPGDLQGPCHIVFNVLYDIYAKCSTADPDDVNFLATGVGRQLFYDSGFLSASRFFEDALRESKGINLELYKRLLIEYGRLNFECSEHEAARAAFQELLSLDPLYREGKPTTEYISLRAMDNLGYLEEKDGNLQVAVKWHQQAYDGFCLGWGAEDLVALDSKSDLDRAMALLSGQNNDTLQEISDEEMDSAVRSIYQELEILDLDDHIVEDGVSARVLEDRDTDLGATVGVDNVVVGDGNRISGLDGNPGQLECSARSLIGGVQSVDRPDLPADQQYPDGLDNIGWSSATDNPICYTEDYSPFNQSRPDAAQDPTSLSCNDTNSSQRLLPVEFFHEHTQLDTTLPDIPSHWDMDLDFDWHPSQNPLGYDCALEAMTDDASSTESQKSQHINPLFQTNLTAIVGQDMEVNSFNGSLAQPAIEPQCDISSPGGSKLSDAFMDEWIDFESADDLRSDGLMAWFEGPNLAKG